VEVLQEQIHKQICVHAVVVGCSYLAWMLWHVIVLLGAEQAMEEQHASTYS
jgi:hypothetical protein